MNVLGVLALRRAITLLLILLINLKCKYLFYFLCHILISYLIGLQYPTLSSTMHFLPCSTRQRARVHFGSFKCIGLDIWLAFWVHYYEVGFGQTFTKQLGQARVVYKIFMVKRNFALASATDALRMPKCGLCFLAVGSHPTAQIKGRDARVRRDHGSGKNVRGSSGSSQSDPNKTPVPSLSPVQRRQREKEEEKRRRQRRRRPDRSISLEPEEEEQQRTTKRSLSLDLWIFCNLGLRFSMSQIRARLRDEYGSIRTRFEGISLSD